MPALYSHTTRANGTVLTATIYNGDHQNHIDNGVPLQLDDYSVNVVQMQTVTDPGGVGTESLATSMAGEFERLRFVLKQIKGTSQWYEPGTQSNALLGIRVFTTTTVYTPTAGTRSILVYGVGGGGAGGGVPATGGAASGAGAGGNGGAFAIKRITSAFSGVTITIGTGGAGVSAGNGGNGTASTFGGLLSIPGGGGGLAGIANSGAGVSAGSGGSSGAPTGEDIGSPGSFGEFGLTLSSTSAKSGRGGDSPFGQGGQANGANAAIGANGIAATGFGSGGGGAVAVQTGLAVTGGAGAPGVFLVFEYT